MTFMGVMSRRVRTTPPASARPCGIGSAVARNQRPERSCRSSAAARVPVRCTAAQRLTCAPVRPAWCSRSAASVPTRLPGALPRKGAVARLTFTTRPSLSIISIRSSVESNAARHSLRGVDECRGARVDLLFELTLLGGEVEGEADLALQGGPVQVPHQDRHREDGDEEVVLGEEDPGGDGLAPEQQGHEKMA